MSTVPLRTVLRRGYRFSAECSEDCDLLALLSLDKRTARELKVPQRVVAQSEHVAEAGEKTLLVMRMRSRAKGRLARVLAVTLRLHVAATDRSGNRVALDREITLKRYAPNRIRRGLYARTH